MSTTDWEKRARELCWPAPFDGSAEHVARALQLGKEMAEAAVRDELDGLVRRVRESDTERDRATASAVRKAADARAEEIAKATEAASEACTHLPGFAHSPFCPWCLTREADARRARSTITKPEFKQPPQLDMEANPLAVAPDGAITGTLPCGHSAEDILVRIKQGEHPPERTGQVCGRCATKPKTREQVLEEALHFYASQPQNEGNPLAKETSPGTIARRALGWKPS